MEGARQYRESNMTYTLYILGEELSHMYPISCNWGNVLYVVSFDVYSKYMYMCSVWFAVADLGGIQGCEQTPLWTVVNYYS